MFSLLRLPLFSRRESARRSTACVALAALAVVAAPSPGLAQTATKPSPTQAHSQTADAGSWASLSPAQKSALRPLEREWGSIDPERRVKWLDIAQKFSTLPAAEQARIQARMEDWARMTPQQRGQARMNFKEAQQVPAQERRDRWEAYKALPADQQKQLAARAAPPARKVPPADQFTGSAETKSNVVPNSSYAPRPKPIAPTVAQAQPGATTNLITKRPSPPAHQPAGLPKIAVTQGFVDQSTLLPKRGPQGAATRSAAASAPGSPRQ